MIHRIFVALSVIALGGSGLCFAGERTSWTPKIYKPVDTSKRVLSLSQKKRRDTQHAQQQQRAAEQQRLRDALKIARKIENKHEGLLVKASSLLGVDAEGKKKLTSAVKNVSFGVVSKGLEIYASTGRYYKPKAANKSLKRMQRERTKLLPWLDRAMYDFRAAITNGDQDPVYTKVLTTRSVKDRLFFMERQFMALNKVLRADKGY